MSPTRRNSIRGDSNYPEEHRWPWARAKRLFSTPSQALSQSLQSNDATASDQIADSSNGKTGRAAKAKSSAAALTLLIRTLTALILISTISVAIPPQPGSPEYYLRLAQFCIDYSPALLLLLALSILASFLDGNSQQTKRQLVLARQISSIAFATYAFLVPLQLFCFGWLWVDSGSQVRAAISSTETRLGSLRKSIDSANSISALATVLANNQLPLPPPSSAPSLDDQKRALIGAIDRDISQLRTKLNQNRLERISALLIGTLRGVAGSIAMGAGLFALKRLI